MQTESTDAKRRPRVWISSEVRLAKRRQSRGQALLLRMLLGSVLALLWCSTAPLAFAQTSASSQPKANAGANAAVRSTAAISRTASLVDAGRIVFNQRCEICHFSESSARKIGPGLKGLFTRTRFASGSKISEASVAGVIRDGGKDMPGYSDVLKSGQIQALIAYLKSH